MQHNKVFVTGLGLISALGTGLEETLDAFAQQKVNVSDIPDWVGSSLSKKVFAVKNIPEKAIVNGDRTLSLAFAAVEEAMAMAALQNASGGVKIGVCMGTTVASQLNDIPFYSELRAGGDPELDAVFRYLCGNLSQAIADKYDFSGPVSVVVNACSSGTDAIGIAKSWIETGFCDIAIAGGADELNRVPIAGFNSLSVYGDGVAAPFDRDRTGLNLGEGAGVLVLESENSMTKRGVKAIGECVAYSTAIDAYHLTAPSPEGHGLSKAIHEALKKAAIDPIDIAFVNAHGTSTRNNDSVEGTTLKRIFGDKLCFLSTKGYTGHTLGAAGGLEAVFAILALQEGWIPANAGFINEDPDIAISPVAARTTIGGEYALSTSLAFGGNNSALIMRKV